MTLPGKSWPGFERPNDEQTAACGGDPQIAAAAASADIARSHSDGLRLVEPMT
jgi:hypothetical protein